jgi:hypothetical protein
VKNSFIIAVLFSLLAHPACHKRDLRGSSKPSDDGKTYLVVADDNGGHCELTLDGKAWPHAKGQPGRVQSGHHSLSSCGAEIGFDIPEGVVYTFDYWGP